MNPALKQRLVGAIVLVALAVIFLPMLLDGSGAREQLDEAIAIPEKPEPPESRLEPVEPTGTAGETTPAAQDEAASAAQPAAADTEPAATDPAATEPAPSDAGTGTTADSAAGADEAETADAEAEGSSGDDAERVSEGWVVQVGSFRRETNAVVLRDRLRQEGFDASAERASADGTTVWRVLVGPVAEREQGETLKRRLESLRGEQALLMSYP